MEQRRSPEIHQINYLSSEMESLYHQASLKLGMSDSVSIVLYTIYDAGEDCLLRDIYQKSGISKQTVNSAIRALEADGILYLEQHTGRSKKVFLTRKGRDYLGRTAAKLYEAEAQAFASWPREEIAEYIRLMGKYVDCFRRQVEEL